MKLYRCYIRASPYKFLLLTRCIRFEYHQLNFSRQGNGVASSGGQQFACQEFLEASYRSNGFYLAKSEYLTYPPGKEWESIKPVEFKRRFGDNPHDIYSLIAIPLTLSLQFFHNDISKDFLCCCILYESSSIIHLNIPVFLDQGSRLSQG